MHTHRIPILFLMGLTLLFLVPGQLSWADGDICPYHKLTWDDFKGPAPTGDEDAEITSGTNSDWQTGTPQEDPPGSGNWTCKLSDVKVSAEMDKSKSGVKPGTKSDELLQHEQYHFDISQYWAGELEKALKGVVGKGKTAAEAAADAKAQGDKIDQEQAKKCDEMQEKYDKETDHGRDKDKQKEWCEKIGKLLPPPPPNRDEMQNSPSRPGQGSFQPENKEFRANSFFDVFQCLELPIEDPFLKGSRLILPPLRFRGFHMEGRMPLLMPEPLAAQMAIVTPQNQVALEGQLRLLIGQDNQLTGWIEAVQFPPNALQKSPMLQIFHQFLGTGRALLTLQLRTQAPLEVLTQNFTQPAQFPLLASLGTAVLPAVAGKVDLLNCLQPAGTPIFFSFRPLNGTAPLLFLDLLEPDGSFFLPSVPPGDYQVAIKGDKWLQQVQPINVGSLEVTLLSAKLIPGDANDDNHVDIFDLATLAESFNTGPRDANWNPATDFNCDGMVDIFDLATLAEYFNTDGDF